MSGINYRDDFKLWWPDYDQNGAKCIQYVNHRVTDMDLAIRRCKKTSTCVQAGGHVGLWPRRLSLKFPVVWTFEPDPFLFECLKRNCESYPGITVSKCALGAEFAQVRMLPAPSAGSWRVDPSGHVLVEQITIDSLNLTECDALFLDIEGYELQALLGAAETIEKFSPVIMVELLPRSHKTIMAHLTQLGYKISARVHGDVIYVRP